jgi:tetratricopeptide (TPR) repeat protein
MRLLVSCLIFCSVLTYGQSERAILYAQATEYGYNNQFKEAEEILSVIIEINPLDSLAYLDRGIMRENMGDTIGAIADFSKEIEIDPKSADNYFLRGMLYQKTKRYEEALLDFRKVNHLDRGNADAHFFSAQMAILLKRNKFKVKRQLKICLKMNPDHVDAKALLQKLE